MTDTGDSAASYEAAYRVRFDEAGPDGRLRTSGLLRRGALTLSLALAAS